MRVIVADDAALFREGVARLLEDAGFEVVGQAGDAEQVLSLVGRLCPDVAVVDIRMPPTHTDEGLRAALEIRKRTPATGVLILSQYVEASGPVRAMVGTGQGFGYLLKDRVADVGEFVEAIPRVARGESVIDPLIVDRLLRRRRSSNALDDLTARERHVLALMAEGCTNEAIVRQLSISPKTVEVHIRTIFSKLSLEPMHAYNRRVLAVLTYLQG